MKIATLLGSLSRANGGVSEVARRLSQELARRAGCEVEVLGLRDRYFLADLPSWRPLEPRAFEAMPPRSFGYAGGYFDALTALRPDVVHVHGLWTYPGLAARQSGAPYVVTVHGMLDPWALANSGWKKRLAGALFERRNLARAACVHAITGAEREAILAYGVKAPVCVIPNGVDLPPESIAAGSPYAAFARGRKVLLYLGRIHPKKGLLQLLEGWHEAKLGEDWVLAIAGWDQGGFTETLQRRAAELGLGETLHFLGPQFGEAKAAAYHHADAFVLPSFSEGLPLVVLEAWAHRLPVLMTPECALPIGFAQEAAVRIEPNPPSIAAGLRAFAQLPAGERQAMGQRGRALVARDFTWPAVAAEMQLVYEWVLGQSPRPASVV